MNPVPASEPVPAVAPASTVLVIDDNHMVTQALAALVRQAGFAPVICHSGADALAFPVENGAPGAAVVDIHLPDINGLILAQKLRDRFGPDTPIVIVSGDTSMETINSLSYVGATHFFPKPVKAEALIERLKELITGDAPREIT